MKHCVRQEIITSLVLAFFCVILFFLPRSESAFTQNGKREKAVVLSVDNSHISMHGHLKYGSQDLTVRLKSGKHKGKVFSAANEMRAQLELDKDFKPGDLVLVNILPDDTPENPKPEPEPEPDTGTEEENGDVATDDEVSDALDGIFGV